MSQTTKYRASRVRLWSALWITSIRKRFEYERLGALHYTGLIDSWSNLYTRFAIAMDAKNRGDEETLKNLVYPDLEHGIDGIRWVLKCVESADKGGVWVDFK